MKLQSVAAAVNAERMADQEVGSDSSILSSADEVTDDDFSDCEFMDSIPPPDPADLRDSSSSSQGISFYPLFFLGRLGGKISCHIKIINANHLLMPLFCPP